MHDRDASAGPTIDTVTAINPASSCPRLQQDRKCHLLTFFPLGRFKNKPRWFVIQGINNKNVSGKLGYQAKNPRAITKNQGSVHK